MEQLCLSTKIRTKQWLVSGASAFVCERIFCARNATILVVYIPAKIKMSFIWKDNFFFFFAKIGFFSKSRASPLFSVVQLYIQPSSFGGRIKLVICQIRHELSVTIYEISFSWKKKNVSSQQISGKNSESKLKKLPWKVSQKICRSESTLNCRSRPLCIKLTHTT